jgi:hypothetical protein
VASSNNSQDIAPSVENKLLTSPLYRPEAEPPLLTPDTGGVILALPLLRKAAARPSPPVWPVLLGGGSDLVAWLLKQHRGECSDRVEMHRTAGAMQ